MTVFVFLGGPGASVLLRTASSGGEMKRDKLEGGGSQLPTFPGLVGYFRLNQDQDRGLRVRGGGITSAIWAQGNHMTISCLVFHSAQVHFKGSLSQSGRRSYDWTPTRPARPLPKAVMMMEAIVMMYELTVR